MRPNEPDITNIALDRTKRYDKYLPHQNVAINLALSVKVAEHSFRARFCWCNLARAQGFQNADMPSIERSFYLLNTRTICVILYNWTPCIYGFSLLLQRYVTKGNDAKNLAIFSFCLLPKETQSNATHAQLLKKLRPIALA